MEGEPDYGVGRGSRFYNDGVILDSKNGIGFSGIKSC